MKRWLLIFLMVLLPLQMSWAAVSNCCEDWQATTTVSTVTADGHDAKLDLQAVTVGGDTVDADCLCDCGHHFNSGAVLLTSADISPRSDEQHAGGVHVIPPSHIPDTLFKPDWRRSA